jgi:Zn-dependent protease
MVTCAHCGNDIIGEPFLCNDCGLNYCSYHREPLNHECSIVRENIQLQQTPSPPTTYVQEPQQQISQQTVSSGMTRGTTDGSYTWYRQETQVPFDAFDPDSGIQFKGILFSHLSEFIHFLIASILIYIIGFMIFFKQLGLDWTTFLLAGIYMTAFLFHEFGHRQMALHFKLQTKFRLLTFGMGLTVFSLVASLLNIPIPSLALPGAVVVLGLEKIGKKTGLCKAAGPLVNLVYGSVLFIVSFIIPNSLYPLNYVFVIAAYLNFMLGAFNMIPIGILDGQNIWKWNKKVYILLAVSLVILLVVTLIFQQSPELQVLYT